MKTHVRFTKDLPEVKMVEGSLGPFTAGDEAEVWMWAAAVLERHGIAAPTQKLTASELRKLILAEERSSLIAPLPGDFYSSVAREISVLRGAGEYERAEELGTQALSLMDTRLPKLLGLALTPENPKGATFEEHFLINRLAEVVEDWSRRLGELFEKTGEDVGKHELGKSVQRAAGDEADIQEQGVSAP